MEPNYLTTLTPPTKDAGQSPLQVAVKSGRRNKFAVANALLDRGADVNFREVSDNNTWHAPVLHDAIRAAVLSTVDADAEVHEAARALLMRMVALGADLHAEDSFGNVAITRFALDARQVLLPNDPSFPQRERLVHTVAGILLTGGADPDVVDTRLGTTVRQQFAAGPVGPLFRAALAKAGSADEPRPG
jgi:hypothetical protein